MSIRRGLSLFDDELQQEDNQDKNLPTDSNVDLPRQYEDRLKALSKSAEVTEESIKNMATSMVFALQEGNDDYAEQVMNELDQLCIEAGFDPQSE